MYNYSAIKRNYIQKLKPHVTEMATFFLETTIIVVCF